MDILEKLISKDRMRKLVEDHLINLELPDKFPSDGTRWKVIVEKGNTNDMAFESEYYFKTSKSAQIFAKVQVEDGNKIEIWKLMHKW
jgi:hypothetical protein